MSGRHFHIDRATGDIDVLWRQSVIKERFEGVAADLDELFDEMVEKSGRYPPDYREGYLSGLRDALECLRISLEDRFDELKGTGQPKEKFNKNFRSNDEGDFYG